MKLRFLAGLSVVAGLVVACAGSQTKAPAGGASTDACEIGKTAYEQHREQLLLKASQTACSADADCGLLTETNPCRANCGAPVLASAIDEASADLSAFSKQHCGSCPPAIPPPCVPPAPVTCWEGRCVQL